ncbi:putative FMN-dependent luciferase-like monooxygenase [Paracoccus denitrificans]|jgi:putative FMN-dependent luciferase-like monooxygenase|uniref:Luciferase family protein n=1 Tax=Paracoccus denitrificans (strain Pd 1222) TaxID=318586 RepID=A1BBR7_PARDP|nr:putative FMN-dependent luciferase-like monooxygenase [Paracoccus denitrificans]ABL72961.1 luciferase family protein [Paracoccus denitrificans PD1222]MBB4626438.1 putative FMN-dependent luciferase-like monooxygenase [Paracoccus denitrificans]MCU7427358.1 putative FMN-dependent luciferase-like monooxygenase [Paracoccus denitrificans]QAR29361.1 putative FMN-dependent luciferase-like monooxygenase [Paracoccus denitrificans]UPV98310.1 putative FMN-dependent luciferase-like monooxygenase [Paracoc
MSARIKKPGFFTRLLDDAGPAERYSLVTEQIRTAERFGYHTAWVAQHHFHRDEGGLPAPLVFLAHVAARTSRIRLAIGVVTLPLEHPVRVAEDAVVLDLLSGGRLDLGLGTGGTPESYAAFGHDHADRATIYDEYIATLRKALAGADLGGGNRLYPAAGDLASRIWQATFSVPGGVRAGRAGDGLLLSRTQPRSKDNPAADLHELQLPIVEAYHAALPAGAAPRILASRSVFVADSRAEARRLAEIGLRRVAAHFAGSGHILRGDTLDDLIRTPDSHVGTPDEVAESLAADPTLDHATEVAIQVHSIDPPHPLILRSIELFATRVAPAPGWADAPCLSEPA